MRTLIFIISLIFTNHLFAQDYFVVVRKNDNQNYRYPEEVKINIFDKNGTKTVVEKGYAITVEGDYTVEVEVPWREEPEIIKSEGGMLEIFVLPEDSWKYERSKQNESYNNYDQGTKPKLERKSVEQSGITDDRFNLLLVFNNGTVFSVNDGKAGAWQDGDSLRVENTYLVHSPDGLLEASFDEKTGETWWVWEL